MFGLEEMYTALNVTEITDLLDIYGTGKALFPDLIVPNDFQLKKSINYYSIAPINGAAAIEQYQYSINCRAETMQESLTIAYTVNQQLNRAHGVDSFKICSVLQTIPPGDETDLYNTPITITLKKR